MASGRVQKAILNLKDSADREELIQAEVSLENLLLEEEIYWRQRAKDHWLMNGDKNTRWFHNKASYRKKKNHIVGMEDRSGQWVSEFRQVEDTISEYFSSLFSSSNPDPMLIQESLRDVMVSVSDEMNQGLLRPFVTEEVEVAAKQIHPNKAPGPDGLSGSFFHKCWKTVGPDVTKVCLDVLNRRSSPEPLNDTMIVLIPKIPSPRKVAEFRPISLCNFSYKIISKAIVNRMKKILHALISPNQSAFVPGRCVVDNAILGYECIHSLRNRRQGRSGWAALKLDMSKAYDRVEWSFLRQLMLKMGFDPQWVELIWSCISSVTFSFNLNGIKCGHIVPSRGLRQGDPLSPYLFLLCAEGLSKLLHGALVRKQISGLSLARNGFPISHLLFADDSLLFFKAKLSEAVVIRNLLKIYEGASGQEINFDKSGLAFSPNSHCDLKEGLGAFFGVPVVDCHHRYLGLPTFMPRNRKSTLHFIKDRIWKQLQAWKGKLFSSGGK